MKNKDILAFRGISKTRMQLAKLYAELFGLPFRVEFVEFDIEKGEFIWQNRNSKSGTK